MRLEAGDGWPYNDCNGCLADMADMAIVRRKPVGIVSIEHSVVLERHAEPGLKQMRVHVLGLREGDGDSDK